jgi:Holliday junction resolvase RusA-like endonuclease
MYEANKGTKPWRRALTDAFRKVLHDEQRNIPIGACKVTIEFYMPRPKSRPTDVFHHVKPDVDKLSRAVLDSLTDAGVIQDDSRVVKLTAMKLYEDAQHRTGCIVMVEEFDW